MKKRILTGDRPTSRLHIGHYVGSLQNRVKLQSDYETFIIIADIQALTTHFKEPDMLKKNVYEVALDNLAVGINPEISTLFIQSMIPQIAELTIYFSMFTTVNMLKHNPTIKAEASQYGYTDLNYGFLGYPVSQAADITFCRADLVPVGEDQLPHIELTRKLVRRFNDLYKPILIEPEALLSSCSRLVGLDGNSKMSKSLKNSIYLADTEEEVKSKIKGAVTDSNRVTIRDKGNPDICTVFSYHRVFNENESYNIYEMCKNAGIGCAACKKNLSKALNETLAPIRERRSYYENNIKRVKDILYFGSEKVRRAADETLDEVKNAVGIKYFK